MKQLRKPAKRLIDRLNKKRSTRLTLKLNDGRIVPRTYNPPGKDTPEEELIYATKAEQRGLRKRGGAGKLTKHKIKSFYMETGGGYQGGTTGIGVNRNGSSTPGSTSTPSRSTGGYSGSPSSGYGAPGGSANPANNSNRNSSGSQGGQGTQNASREAQGNVAGRPSGSSSSQGGQQGTQDASREAQGNASGRPSSNIGDHGFRDPTRSEALAEGVRSLAEKARDGISTPTASGSPVNNPVNMNPFRNLRDAVTQRQAAAEIAATNDLTAKASMAGVEDLRRSAYDKVMGGLVPQNLGFSGPAPAPAPRDDRALIGDTVAQRLADLRTDREPLAPPASSDITQGSAPIPVQNPLRNTDKIIGDPTFNPATDFGNVVPATLSRLVELQKMYDKQIQVTAGTELGHVPKSQHRPGVGTALDLSVPTKDRALVASLADKVGFGGIGTYGNNLPNMVHVDTRATDEAWGPTGKYAGISQLKDKALQDALRAHEPPSKTGTGGPNTTVSPAAQAAYADAEARGLLGPADAVTRTAFSPPSNFKASAPKAATTLASKFASPEHKPPTSSVTPNSRMTASPANPAYTAALRGIASLPDIVKNFSIPQMTKTINEAASYVKKYANAQTGFFSGVTAPVANGIVAKEAAKAIKSAQLAISNFQKGTLTRVAAAKSLQKAINATKAIQTASIAPTMKPTMVSTKPTVVATKKLQDRLVAEAEAVAQITKQYPGKSITVAAQNPAPQPSIAETIINNIPAVRAVRRISKVGSNVVKRLTRSDVYKDDQAELAAMTPAQRVAELSRRAGEGGTRSNISSRRKLTKAVLKKAAKAASTAVANSKYTSEGYLA